MKVKKWSMNTTEVNDSGATPHEIDVQFNVTRSPDSQAADYDDIFYPNDILLKNGTGAELGYIIIGNNDEYAEWQEEQASPGTYPYFNWIPIAVSEVVSGTIPRAQKIIIKKLSGAATAGLDIYGKLVKKN